MGAEKLLLLSTIVLGIIGMGCIGISQYLNNRGLKVWVEKKETLNIIDRIAYKWSVFLEEIAVQINEETEKKIKKHLMEVFDYIVVKNPDIKAANDYLEMETYMKIIDYWDGPYGRILEIQIAKNENQPVIKFKLNIVALIRQVYATKKSEQEIQDQRPKLRIVK